jgi:hypothetical protein
MEKQIHHCTKQPVPLDNKNHYDEELPQCLFFSDSTIKTWINELAISIVI